MRFAWLVVLLTGCSKILGIQELERAPPDATVSDAPIAEKFTFASAACETCTQKCGIELEACGIDRGCAAVFRELAKCGLDDSICRALAERADPSAYQAPTLLALENCRRTSCFADCYGGVGFGKFNSNCTCLDAACVAKTSGCVRSPAPADAGPDAARPTPPPGAIGDCDRRFGCVLKAAVPDPAVTFDCVDRFPGGTLAMNELRGCMANASCESCSFVGGRNLACSGKYRWAPLRDEYRDLTLKVIEPGGALVPGVRLTLCAEATCEECTVKLGQTEPTDAAGLTTIRVPQTSLAMQVCVKAKKDGYLDATAHIGRPLFARDERPVQCPDHDCGGTECEFDARA